MDLFFEKRFPFVFSRCCLLCDFNSTNDNKIEGTGALEILRKHYISHHSISENNYYFKQLFLPSNYSKKCDICNIEFKNCAVKKNNEFIYHYHQVGGETRYRSITNEYYQAWTNHTIQD